MYEHLIPMALLYYGLETCSFITVYILFSNINVNAKTRHYYLYIFTIYTFIFSMHLCKTILK